MERDNENGRPQGHDESSNDDPIDINAAHHRTNRRRIDSSDDDSSDISGPNDTNDANNHPVQDATMHDLKDTDDEATTDENNNFIPEAEVLNSEEEEEEANNNTAMTTTAETSSASTAVLVCSKKIKATAKDLFETAKRNIRIGNITYTCSHVTKLQKGTIIKKVYLCANVKDPKAGWIPKPGYRIPRNQSKTTVKLEKCKGRIEGNFSRSSFYFGAPQQHTCTINHSGRRCDLDLRPPSLVIAAPTSWGVTNMMISQMKDTLKNAPKDWWAGLPNQDRKRDWLKVVGDPTTPRQKETKYQIEATLKPFLDYIRSIYPEMRHWKVGALRTKANTPSQYEMSKNTFHTDYSDSVLDRPPKERPMSIIMALDSFSFLLKPTIPNSSAREYDEIIVKPGQAVAFTYEQLHAGGQHTGTEYNYRLFAYIVCHKADFPMNEVTHDTPARARESSNRNNNEQLEATKNTGRARKQVNYKA